MNQPARLLLAAMLLLAIAPPLPVPAGGAPRPAPPAVAPGETGEMPVIEHPDAGREMIASLNLPLQSA